MSISRISHVPPGSQDLLADAVRRRRRIQRTWFELAERRGYAEVIPPTFEYEEVFTLGAGADLSRRLLRFVDRDGRVVALRADFTSSIARLAATKLASHTGALRLSYAGKVYRQAAEGDHRGREVFQLGAELIGESGVAGDAEIIGLLIETLRSLGVGDFQVNVGDVRFLRPLLDPFEPAERERLHTAIDRKDRALLAELGASLPGGNGVRAALSGLPDLIGRGPVLERAAGLACGAEAAEAISRLQALDRALPEDLRRHLVYDLGEIRGLDYYTGLQLEVFVAGVGRAVGFGGRYDDLLALYGSDRPAIGFALELDTLAELAGAEPGS